MKLWFAIIAIVCAGAASAQTAEAVRVPTEEEIVPKVLMSDSPYFYPPMMARYMEGDATLTAEHYYYLYYGYAYQPEYDAHKELPGESAIYDILKKATVPTREEALTMVEAAKRNMAVDPFSPANINIMTMACELAGDSLGARRSAGRFRGVVGAITSSGTGLREKSPWHILRFSHANDVVAARGLTVVNRQVRSLDVEYVQVDRNSDGARGYFFDFSRVYWKPYEGERVKKKSNWMFNGTPVR